MLLNALTFIHRTVQILGIEIDYINTFISHLLVITMSMYRCLFVQYIL